MIHLRPTTDIQGIGPATAGELSNAGLDFLSDFFVYTPGTIANGTDHSVERIEKWRAAAAFLEIEDMTPDWAEALVNRGRPGYDRFLFASLEELEQLFQDSLNDGEIAEAPDREMLYLLTKRIARATYGTSIQGQVVDLEGNPIEGAKVSIAQYRATTNSKGFWRLAVMSANSPARLFIQKDDFETHYEEQVYLNLDPLTTSLHLAELSAGDSEDIVWDEFEGDIIPPMTSYNTSTKTLASDDLRQSDVLRVHRIKEETVRLVSVYSKMINQTFTVLAFEIDPERLPDAEEGQYWKYSDGQFTLTRESIGTIPILKRTRRMIKSLEPAEPDDDIWSYFLKPREVNILP